MALSSWRSSVEEEEEKGEGLCPVEMARSLAPTALPVSFLEPRHSERIQGDMGVEEMESWRMKDRMKTVSVALVLCLNIGVDPPDVIKPVPCARQECWLDVGSMSSTKAGEVIGTNLQKQYERWQSRARIKTCLDPTVDDVKKLCNSLRKNARDERVLFHYNGHGVPKPTDNGEIWVFNKNYTQYIPLSLYDLQSWLGAPSVFVYDCNCAGLIMEKFMKFADDHEGEYKIAMDCQKIFPGSGNDPGSSNGISSNGGCPSRPSMVTKPQNFRECIQLAACQFDQTLPTQPDLPADLFTSCLTTPIKTGVLYYIKQNKLTDRFPPNIVESIPGQLNDRRTLLGELNWIFTAITDTIAWNTLSPQVFQKLFRQDLLVASLFRNFLLADRVMRTYNCTPVSSPKLPPTFEHPLWQAWDYALDTCLSSLQIKTPIAGPEGFENSSAAVPPSSTNQSSLSSVPLNSSSGLSVFPDYTHSTFFVSQLTAFEVWLEYGNKYRNPPQQLPVVLQVLLSQVHRVRALELLGRFLDLGPWAVSLALSVGIHPYVLKLLQSAAKELKPLLSFIWAKILSVDNSCQADLVKDQQGFLYFLSILKDFTLPASQRVIPAFVLASIMEDYPQGKEVLRANHYATYCTEALACGTESGTSPLLKIWILIGLGKLWAEFSDVNLRLSAQNGVIDYLTDPVPEVRAATVYALGALVSSRSKGPTRQNDARTKDSTQADQTFCMRLATQCSEDGSPLVRAELAVALHWFVLDNEGTFRKLASKLLNDRQKLMDRFQGQKELLSRFPMAKKPHMKNCFELSSTDLDREESQPLTPKYSFFGVSSSPSVQRSKSRDTMPVGVQGTSHKEKESIDMVFRDEMLILERQVSRNLTENVWLAFLRMSHDPFPAVQSKARAVLEHIQEQAEDLFVRQQELMREMSGMIDRGVMSSSSISSPSRTHAASVSPPNSHPTPVGTPSRAEARPEFVVGSPSDPALSRGDNNNKTPFRVGSIESKPSTQFVMTPVRPTKNGMRNPSPEKKFETPRTRTDSENVVKTAIISTGFLPWAASVFSRPLLGSPPNLSWDMGSAEKKMWKKTCDMGDWASRSLEELKNICETEKGSIARKSTRIEVQKFVSKSESAPTSLAYSPLYPLLISTGSHDISVWNWEQGTRCTRFPNLDKYHGTFDSTSWIDVMNPYTHCYIASGTTSGMVRIWDLGIASQYGYAVGSNNKPFPVEMKREVVGSMERPRLVTAWNMYPAQDGVEQHHTVYQWEQDSGVVVAGGGLKSILIWDVGKEQSSEEIKLKTGNPIHVNCLSSDTTGQKLVAVGCSDGAIRLFDKRIQSKAMTLRDAAFEEPVVGVHMQPFHLDSKAKVVGCSRKGQIRVWEPRMFAEPIMVANCGEGVEARNLAVHGRGELIAVSTNASSIQTFNFRGKKQSTIRYHDGMMGQKIGDVCSLAFHPFRHALATGSSDFFVAVYGLSS